MATNIICKLSSRTSGVIINHVQRRNMPVNVPPTATGKRRFRLAVETDPHKLVNYCCGLNYHKDEPLIPLKPDNEYPDWLWTLRLTPKPHSWEMEKGTKEYYYRLAEEGSNRNYLLRMRAAKPTKTVGQRLKSNEEYLHRLRFAALAHMEPKDAGFDQNSMEQDWWRGTRDPIKVRDYYLPKVEDSVMYKDKIEGNIRLKNYFKDEDSSFKTPRRRVEPYPSKQTPAFQDSKQRHKHSVY